MNPGQSSFLPWGSKTAQLYEYYKWLYLEIYFIPQVSAYATGGQTGELIFSADYNASDPPPMTYTQQTDCIPHSTQMPYVRQSLVMDPTKLHPKGVPKFVRPGGLPSASDIKTYDAGNIFVGSSGVSATSFILGSVHVRYTVELTVPVLDNVNQAPTNNSVSLFRSIQEIGISLNFVIPYETTIVNPLAITNTGGSFVLPSGNYIYDIMYTESWDIALDGFSLNVFRNGTNYNANETSLETIAGGLVSGSGSNMGFIQSNGADVYTVKVVTTGSNNGAYNSQIRFTAI